MATFPETLQQYFAATAPDKIPDWFAAADLDAEPTEVIDPAIHFADKPEWQNYKGSSWGASTEFPYASDEFKTEVEAYVASYDAYVLAYDAWKIATDKEIFYQWRYAYATEMIARDV